MIHQALYERLIETARRQSLISYAEVAPLAGIAVDNPHFGALIGRMLDDINRAENAAGRPLLSAVVVSRSRNAPGAGFFDCARALGRHAGGIDDQFWLDELRRVYAYWSTA